MGLTRTVTGPDPLPPWPAVQSHLASAGLVVQMRMIDGQLAFPDELPPDDWRDLRVAAPAGMLTLRRAAGRIEVVVWGNADAALQETAAAMASALAVLAGGRIITDD